MKKIKKVKHRPNKSRRRTKSKDTNKFPVGDKKSARKEHRRTETHSLVDAGKSVQRSSKRLTLAVTALKNGNPHEAFDICRETLAFNPFDVGALNLAGVAAFQVGLAEEALELLETAAMQSPQDAEIQTNLGNVLAQLGRKSAAKAAYEQAMEVDPEYAEALFNFGIFLATIDHVEEAIVALNKVLEKDSHHTLAWHALGNTYKDASRLGEAKAAFESALKIDPGFPLAHINLAAVLNEIGDFRAAVSECKTAIKLKSDLYEAYYNLGTALQELGRHKEAVAAYKKVLSLQPNHAAAAMNIGYGLQQLGCLEEASGAYEKSIAIDSSFAKAHVNFADLKLQQGNSTEALIICNNYLEHKPANADLLACKAMVLGETGNKKEQSKLIDYDRFLSVHKIRPPTNYSGLNTFNEALNAHIASHPTLNYAPQSHATRAGHHTGELLVEPMGPFADLKALILAAVDNYRESVGRDSSHPFLSSCPARIRLSVWGVVMESLGHQIPHIHPSAWLSGVYYAKVPTVVNLKDAGQSGWLVLGQLPRHFHNVCSGEIRPIKPEAGLMILFPSYFYHHTIPFDTNERRVSIAFDLVAD